MFSTFSVRKNTGVSILWAMKVISDIFEFVIFDPAKMKQALYILKVFHLNDKILADASSHRFSDGKLNYYKQDQLTVCP